MLLLAGHRAEKISNDKSIRNTYSIDILIGQKKGKTASFAMNALYTNTVITVYKVKIKNDLIGLSYNLMLHALKYS